ncbi:beta-lactamase family protein [Porticoccaceae bacterium]|nr:beta-lactamase family protein [Porticoccaceae bacterium]
MKKLFFSKYLRFFACLSLCLSGLAVNGSEGLQNGHFPSEVWQAQSAEAVNVNPIKLKKLFDLSFEDPSTQGAALFKNGKLIKEHYAEGYSEANVATSWSMAKSFYAALVGISIERGEIGHLDEKLSLYLDYFSDDRRDITIRQLLNMTSGLEMPSHEHEKMFFTKDHLAYARQVKFEQAPDQVFEYNNVNSMLLADLLLEATGMPADILLRKRIFNKIGLTNVALWQDTAGNALTYCCVDTTVRQYARFGLLFARGGQWQDQQVIPKTYVDETLQQYWSDIPSNDLNHPRGYSLHWWVSRYDEQSKIFNASGKFGQYIFVDPANDVVFVRVTKYHPTGGEKIDWGPLSFLNKIGSVEFRRKLAMRLSQWGWIDIQADVKAPMTFDDGVSNQFSINYSKIIDNLATLNQP